MNQITLTCTCGVVIPEDNIYHYSGNNELGEDYGIVEAYCSNCETNWEASKWGEWDGYEEAVEYLQEYMEVKRD